MIKKTSYYTSAYNETEPLTLLSHPFDLLLFDIETTGFDRIKDQVISITTAYTEATNSCGEFIWTITQWFTESLEDEKTLLLEVNELFNAKPVHITYNGHSFDIPFLYCKYQYYNIFTQINKSKCYDLYRIARHSLTLNSYKLKAIELALGISREDLISGKDCVELYRLYEKNHLPEIPEKILLHNFEDVVNMIRLSKMLKQTPPAYLDHIRVIQFNFKDLTFVLEDRHLTEHYLDLHFKANLSPTDEENLRIKTSQHYFGSGEHLNLYREHQTYKLEIRLSLSRQVIDGHSLLFVAYTQDSIAQKIAITDLSDLLIKIDELLQWNVLLSLIHKILDDKNQLSQ